MTQHLKQLMDSTEVPFLCFFNGLLSEIIPQNIARVDSVHLQPSLFCSVHLLCYALKISPQPARQLGSVGFGDLLWGIKG